jgi:hypothetical protein
MAERVGGRRSSSTLVGSLVHGLINSGGYRMTPVDDEDGPTWMRDVSPEVCFVIQPFDKGPYDDRYEDVYKEAIEAAGLRPYRVDRDPSATIPIDRIASQIRDAVVCFADISEDNPNVWFELGLAIASRKEVVLACSGKRARFPFDIQHRHVIKYETESPRDFEALRSEITERLRAARKLYLSQETIEDLSPVKSTAGLSAHEQVMLVVIAQRMDSPDSTVTSYFVRQDMQSAGFNDIAMALSARSLRRRDFVATTTDSDQNGEPYAVYRVTDVGFDWLEQNQDKLELRRPSAGESDSQLGPGIDTDTDIDDLPF